MVVIDSSIFRFKGNDLTVFLYLLTHADDNGMCDTSYAILSHELGLSVQSLRTITNRLRATGEIVCESTNKITHVTISNYESYVPQTPERQQAKSRVINKPNCKDLSLSDPKEKLEKDRKVFYDSLVPYVGTYGKEMVRQFYDYWSETNKSQTKMRFQLEKTWDTSKRLARWSSHNYNGNNNGKTNTEKFYESVAEANEFSQQLKSRIAKQTELDFGDNEPLW